MQQIGAYGGQMNSDIILESTGPRLYSGVYHRYIPLSVQEQPYPGELQARLTLMKTIEDSVHCSLPQGYALHNCCDVGTTPCSCPGGGCHCHHEVQL